MSQKFSRSKWSTSAPKYLRDLELRRLGGCPTSYNLSRKILGDPFDLTVLVRLQGGSSIAALVCHRFTAAWSCPVTHCLSGRLFVISSQSCVWAKPRGEHCRSAAQSPVSAGRGHLWCGKLPHNFEVWPQIRSDQCWLVCMGFISPSLLLRANIQNLPY